jgi:type I restriction enzyme, R subunit
MHFNESTVEEAALSWFEELGYGIRHGPEIAPGEPAAERASFGDVVLISRLRDAIDRINPDIPHEAREEALRKVLRVATPSLVGSNRAFHWMLRDGVEVEYRRKDGSIAGDRVHLTDFDNLDNNDWLAVNQFTVIEGQHNRRADIVIFINGLPLAVIELKNAADENATIWEAFKQLQTYKQEIPSLFHYNEVLVVSDGLQARMGSLTANKEWFKIWRDDRGTGFQPVIVNQEDHGQDGRATGARGTEGIVRIRQGAYLPHWTREGGIYAVNFRLADALPQHVVAEWKQEREEIVRRAEQAGRKLSASENKRLQALFSDKVEKYLDAGHGKCWMRRPEIATMIENSLKHFDGDRYRLIAWCVMPNHVHVVVMPIGAHELHEIVHSWKSYTANQANRMLNRTGMFWQPEPYDHLIRDEEDLIHSVEYTLSNPEAAGLKDWKWVGCAPDILAIIEEGGTGFQPVNGNQEDNGQDGRATSILELEVLIRGVFDKQRLLKLLRYFVAFEEDKERGQVYKILAGYHQFHAVQKAIDAIVEASRPAGDRRCGVVWHTQGSGKSLTMLFCAGQIILHPAMDNPTIVALTDRNDLDDQLFGQFQRCHELLRQQPVQADSAANLRELLNVASGGVVFTTIQKFMPDEKGGRMAPLSQRRNIVVIADEAHRSQYDLIDGLARNMRDALPNASFIGFTGTPIEKTDANTRAVFGDYLSVYDIQRAVEDGATVPIYYESRISKLGLIESELPKVDAEFEEITEGQEIDLKEKLKTKWAALEALVGDPKRTKLIARDLVEHFDRRLDAMDGKAMVVCMSRRICVELYNEIVKLHPGWHNEDDQQGAIKIVMTGSASDRPDWQQHIRGKSRRAQLAARFKNPSDRFQVAIVRDMWLTGFDVPCLHTMYVDKPMRGHGLMQAIARVNRVYRDKPGGLVVDYLGLADQLKQALAAYTESGGQGTPSIDTAEAVAVLLAKYEICCGMMHGFDWGKWITGSPAERLGLIPPGQEHVLQQEDGKPRFIRAVNDVSRAFALCAADDEAIRLRDDISFFQAVRAALAKPTGERMRGDDLDHAVRQLVSKAILAPDEVIDVFSAAGLKKPDISILSDEFLAEVRALKHKNVAAEVLAKLLGGEIKLRAKRQLVQSRVFSEMLKKTLNAYHNRAIATQEIIEELIRLAKEMRAATNRGEELGLNDDEIAFYDALAMNESAVKAMGSDELKVIAAELVTQVRKSVTIDWTVRESARAKIRVMVRRILRKFGYPPDLQEEATRTILEQAELMCADWAG